MTEAGETFYTDGQREAQRRADSARLASSMAERIVHSELTAGDRAFIEARDMFFLATVDSRGQANCSYKGGEPGFVRVLDERTIAFPNYDGNGMFLSLGSIADSGEVGLLFIDFEGQSRMRLNGTATVHHDDPLLQEYPEAQAIVRVVAREVFPNCPRYIHKMELVERSTYVPKADCETPQPEWKQAFADVLPAGDPSRGGDA
jgi:predicted pyridoxine 5'-phosphate oxidase superfamily flavin-nucleotide-binding protein